MKHLRRTALVVLPITLAGCIHNEFNDAAASLPTEKAAAAREGIPLDVAEVWPKSVPADQDASPIYEKAATQYKVLLAESSQLTDLLALQRGLGPSEVSTAAAGISTMKPILDAVDKATARPYCRYQHDFSATGDHFSFPEVSDLKSLAKLVSLKAKVEIAQGHTAEAGHELSKLLKIAAHTGEEPTLIAGLVQAAEETMFFHDVEILLETNKGNAQSIAIVEQALKSVGPIPSFVDEMVCELVSDNDDSGLYELKPEDLETLGITKEDVAEVKAGDVDRKVRDKAYSALSIAFCRKMIPMLRDTKLSADERANRLIQAKKDEYQKGGAHLYLGLDAPILSPTTNIYKLAAVRHEMVRAALRILVFKNSQGHFPPKLPEASGKGTTDLIYRTQGDGFTLEARDLTTVKEYARFFRYLAPAKSVDVAR